MNKKKSNGRRISANQEERIEEEKQGNYRVFSN